MLSLNTEQYTITNPVNWLNGWFHNLWWEYTEWFSAAWWMACNYPTESKGILCLKFRCAVAGVALYEVIILLEVD